MGDRVGLTEEDWALIGSFLPVERGRGCRPAQDYRRYFEGVMWMMSMARTQGRHLPDEYAKWNSVFRRHRRSVETGMCDTMLEARVELVESDGARAMSARILMPSPQKFSFLGIAGAWMFMLGLITCEIGLYGLIVQFCRSYAAQQRLAALPPDFGAVGDVVSVDVGIAQYNGDEAVAAGGLLEGDAT